VPKYEIFLAVKKSVDLEAKTSKVFSENINSNKKN
jgi:hypothetical protein